MQKHYVTFYSPGTFFPEINVEEIDSWDVEKAVEMAGKIDQRDGARPYCFVFRTDERKETDWEPKTIKTSQRYWLGGKVETLDEVKAHHDPNEKTLIRNMESNKIKRVITNTNSFKFTGEFLDDDILLDVKLPERKQKAG